VGKKTDVTSNNSSKKARPWLKRISYVIAGGTVVGAWGAWFAHSSTMQKVYIDALAAIIKNKTGLKFEADGLSFSLLKGHARLYRPSLEADLFRADEINISLSLRSLFGNAPHITKLAIINPVSNINAARLSRIKLQSDGPSPDWKLDFLEISGGRLFVEEPEWRLPHVEVSFSASAVGPKPKLLRLDSECSRIAFAGDTWTLSGSANFTADIGADAINLRHFNFDSELLKFKAEGAFDTLNNVVECDASGSIFSQSLADTFGEDFSGLDGRADFHASVSGGADNPEWTLQANGRGLKTGYKPLGNCSIDLEASGGTSEIEIKKINISAGNSSLVAQGTLKSTESRLLLNGRNLPFSHLSGTLNAPVLESATADFRAVFLSPAPLWSANALGQFNMSLNAVLNRNGYAAGNLVVTASEKSVKIDSFNLDIPDLTVSANGSIGMNLNVSALSDSAPTSFDFNAVVSTTAEHVAFALDAWKIVDHLPISGEAHTKTHVTWSPYQGLRMNGNLLVENPVYYGATADILTTDIKIESDQLFLDNMHLKRGAAEADGHLWLTWASLPKGKDQIRMRYESSGLPLSEGLAVGISDNKILEDMSAEGRVDGWVTFSGPYNSMVLQGEAKLYDASIYGVSIPALSCSVKMDLDKQNRLLVVPELRLADSRENLDTLSGSLGLKGNLDMDLASKTWKGRIVGLADSHVLGMTTAPRMSAQVAIDLDGPFVADYGSIVIPEGKVILSEGQIDVGRDVTVEGLTGNLSVSNGSVLGSLFFHDYIYSENTLLELDARKNQNALTGWLRVALSHETADTENLARAFTKGALDDLNLSFIARGRLSDRGLTWRSDIDMLNGRIFGLEFSQQSLGSLDGNSDGIKLAFDLGSRNVEDVSSDPLSRLRVNGEISHRDTQAIDFTFVGTADLEQIRNVLAGVFDESRDTFLAGFTPDGVGMMDLRLHGPIDAMGLDGTMQIRGARLQPGRDFPYGIENLNLDLSCQNRRIALKNLEGRMARGRLSCFGDVVWNNSGVESYQIQTQLDNFQYSYKPEGFQLDASVNALFHNIPGGKGEIRGTLRASNMAYVAEINLARIILENSIGAIPGIPNIEFDNPMDSINLNLDVELSQPWIFDTNIIKIKGMPSEKFKILGTLANPGLLGSIDFAPGGRITNILPAGDIIVEKGSIDFPDPSIMNPMINIQGQIDISPFRVNLSVQGPLDSINITPTSTPTLRQDEVISLILNPAVALTLGNSAYNNSLASATVANGLIGAASGLLITNLAAPLQEQIRRTLRLDRVSVALRTSTPGVFESDVVIGKNINLMGKSIPVTGSYTRTNNLATMGGQMEWRLGNLVIQLGASGGREVGVAPSGEIRYSWSFR